jgi:hypothetical protein
MNLSAIQRVFQRFVDLKRYEKCLKIKCCMYDYTSTFCSNIITGGHQRVGEEKNVFMLAQCINSIKMLFIVPTDAHYYKIVEMLKQFKNYDTCSDMFRFTQEPSSGSSHVLS